MVCWHESVACSIIHNLAGYFPDKRTVRRQVNSNSKIRLEFHRAQKSIHPSNYIYKYPEYRLETLLGSFEFKVGDVADLQKSAKG